MTVQENIDNTKNDFQTEWLEEYQRLGSEYARRAAYIIIFSFPTIIFANYHLVTQSNIATYLAIYFAPSVIIGFMLVFARFRPLRHELMVFVMFVSVFAAATYRTDQETVVIYLIINAVCFIASSAQMLVFPKFNFLLFAYVVLINLVASVYFYGESLTFYLSQKGGLVIIVLGVIFVGVNQLRYKILKNNFINSLALKESYRLLEQKTNIIEENAKEIKQKNVDITASITYAQRIQKAVLPKPDDLQQVIPESFIFFKPRDIISGDFYWFAEVEHKIILAAVDCTGHGVPGAFMSLIGNDYLDKIVNEKSITEANVILEELHTYIRKALKQEENDNADGMDIALVVYDRKQKTLDFAGAKNPLYYVEDNRLKIIKGDKFPIGGLFYRQGENPRFTCHQIDLSEYKPAMFYIFSDGYQDQFGGAKGKKFMVSQFKKLLLSISQKPIAEQRAQLEKTLKDWQGDYPQVDDILVIGFSLD